MLFALAEHGELPRVSRPRPPALPDAGQRGACSRRRSRWRSALSGSFAKLAVVSALARLVTYAGTCARRFAFDPPRFRRSQVRSRTRRRSSSRSVPSCRRSRSSCPPPSCSAPRAISCSVDSRARCRGDPVRCDVEPFTVGPGASIPAERPRTSRSSSATDAQPSSFSVRTRSARRISIARATPGRRRRRVRTHTRGRSAPRARRGTAP